MKNCHLLRKRKKTPPGFDHSGLSSEVSPNFQKKTRLNRPVSMIIVTVRPFNIEHSKTKFF